MFLQPDYITDGAYKKALESLAGKRAALQNKNRTDNIPDFSKEKPLTLTDIAPKVEVELKDAEKLVRDLSTVFRQFPGVLTSQAHFTAANRLERFISSEGTSFVRRSPSVIICVTASTQAVNGMSLHDDVNFYARSMKDVPSSTSLAADVRAMAGRLQKLQSAPVAERYNGPVLFDGQAAGMLIARFFAHQIVAMPNVISDNAQFVQALNTQQHATATKSAEQNGRPCFPRVRNHHRRSHSVASGGSATLRRLQS